MTTNNFDPIQPVQAWRKVFRDGLVPSLSTDHLIALKMGLTMNDPRLLQGATTTPPPLMCTQDWPVECACLVGYAGWQGDGLQTVGETEEFFARKCYEIDQRIGEPAGVRWLLNFWDETPREVLFPLILEEVQRAIDQRMLQN